MRLRLLSTPDAQSTLSLITLHLSAPKHIPTRHRPTASFGGAGSFGAHTGNGLGLGGLGVCGGRIFGVCHACTAASCPNQNRQNFWLALFPRSHIQQTKSLFVISRGVGRMTKRALPEDHKGYGKLILFGEHFVVYKVPALVAAVGLALRMCHGTHLSACPQATNIRGMIWRRHRHSPKHHAAQLTESRGSIVASITFVRVLLYMPIRVCPAPLIGSWRRVQPCDMGSCVRRRLETARLGLGRPSLQLHRHTAHGPCDPPFRSVHGHRMAVYCHGAEAHSTLHKHMPYDAPAHLVFLSFGAHRRRFAPPTKANPTQDVPSGG